MPKPFEFCRVCRRNHNHGRGHKYSIKHKHSLERVLDKFLERIQEVRRFVTTVEAIGKEDQDAKTFWCPFCEQEIGEQQQQSLFKFAQAITHFGSQTHAENVKSFCAEQGSDAEKIPMYVIEGADLARWENAAKIVPPAARNGGGKKIIRSGERSCDATKHSPQVPLTERENNGLSLGTTSIGGLIAVRFPPLGSADGNVHSDAAPPWLKQGNGVANETPKGNPSSHLSPLAQAQEKELAKTRNPNRVGAAWAERRRAELDRGEIVAATEYDNSSWLPRFGRVWQGGSRKDTRREFESEKRLEAQKRGRRGRSLTQKSGGARSVELKPYVSRQQRMASEAALKSGSARP